jgi:hypothetical protein
VSIVFRETGQAVLSGERHADLRRVLWHQAGNRDRLSFILHLPEGEPLV